MRTACFPWWEMGHLLQKTAAAVLGLPQLFYCEELE